MDMEKDIKRGVYILRLSGRFDAHEVPPLQQSLAHTGPQVVVNLQDVHFIDSTALAALVRGMKTAREAGGDLILCGLQKPVRIIFELTRLDRAFNIQPDEAAALASHHA
jgi:anti-sigma B factor antagonist